MTKAEGKPGAQVLKLHKYQKKGASFIIKHKSVYLAIDMGLGKTAIVLEAISRLKQKAFVLAPLRVIYSTWPEEIAKWAPHLSFAIIHGKDKDWALNESDADILLMNYEGLPWLSKNVKKWKRRMVVYDESSMVKSHSTKRFAILRKMQPLWTDYAVEMSATPASNSLLGLWSQYFLLDRGERLGENISRFRERYCSSFSYPGMSVTLYDVRPEAKSRIYGAIAPITYRLEAKDHFEMPELIYNTIGIELDSKNRRKYDTLERDFFLELEKAEVEAPNAAILIMKLRQFVQGGLYTGSIETGDRKWNVLHNLKLRALQELVETSAGQPILCAIQFKGELEMIRKKFPKAPLIVGGTPVKQAKKYILEWNTGAIPLLLCHPASLSHGVNLQLGGHILLWYGIPWSLEQYTQLIGRLWRQGQLNTVVIHHLIIKNSIDEAVMEALKNKNAGQKELLNYLKNYHNRRQL